MPRLYEISKSKADSAKTTAPAENDEAVKESYIPAGVDRPKPPGTWTASTRKRAKPVWLSQSCSV